MKNTEIDTKKLYTSPIVTLMFPKLNEPDYGTKDYPDPDGTYNTKAVFDADGAEHKALRSILEPIHEQAVKEAIAEVAEMSVKQRKALEARNGKDYINVRDLFEELYDKETEEPTGQLALRFKAKAGGAYRKGHPKEGQRWTRKLPLYDSFGHLIAKPPAIWGGTRARISFTVRPYLISGDGTVGLSLGLEAAQIVELRSGGARDASAFGFGVEEGGFQFDPNENADDDSSEDAAGQDEFLNGGAGDGDF